jgi:hypothetical protein
MPSTARWTSLGVWLAALLVYLLTMLPTVGATGDTPKFQFISAIWGIPHPTGYPLYILLGRVFGWLPIGNLAWRINFMSAFFAALTATFFFWTALTLTGNQLASGAFSLAWAFARLFWSQSVIAEVYTLNACFVIAVICFLLLWEKRRQRGWLYAAMATYALSFGNHLSMIFMLPAWLYCVWRVERRVLRDLQAIGVGIASVLVGASPYLYIVLRARQRPSHCEACPYTWTRFVNYVLQPRFGGTVFTFSPTERLPHIGDLLWQQFFGWGIALILVGIAVLWLRERKTALFLSIAVAGLVAWPLNYTLHVIVFYIPAFLILALFGAVGMAAAGEFVDRVLRRWGGWEQPGWLRSKGDGLRAAKMAAVQRGVGSFSIVQWILAAVLVGWSLWQNWAALDQRHNRGGERIGRATYERLEPDSLVYVPDLGLGHTLSYWRHIERPEFKITMTNEKVPVRTAFGQRPIFAIGANVWMQEHYVLDPPPAERLSTVLRRVPEGMIVALVAKDEASAGLTGEAVHALRTIGGAVDLRGCWRCGHLLVGVKGAAPGTAFEAHGYRRILWKRFGKEEQIGDTGVRMPVALLARSAGLDAGNVGDLIIDGVNISPLGRGYNIVVIDPQNGQVTQMTNHDTAVGPHVDGAGVYRIVGRREGATVQPVDANRLDYWRVPEGGIDLGNPDSRRYMASGWGNVEDWGTWAQGQESVLDVVVPPNARQVRLTAMPFAVEGLTQSVELVVNGTSCGQASFVGTEVQNLTFDLSPVAVQEGIDRLFFRFAYAKSPQEVSGAPDARKLAVWFVRLEFKDGG